MTPMMMMMATNCSSTRMRMSCWDVFALPPRSMLTSPSSEDDRDGKNGDRDEKINETGHRVSTRKERRGTWREPPHQRKCTGKSSVAPQQPIEIIQLLLGSGRVAELAPQLVENARGPFGGDRRARQLSGPRTPRASAWVGRAGRRPAFPPAGFPWDRLIAPLIARLLAALLTLLPLLALLHLLHLLGHALHASAQAFESAALGIDRFAVLPLAERALGLAHGVLGVPETLLVLHSLALHPPLQFAQALPQGLLPLAQTLALLLLVPCSPLSPFSACS